MVDVDTRAEMTALAAQLTSEGRTKLTSAHVSQSTIDAMHDFEADVAEMRIIDVSLANALADLESKRDYVPEAGYAKLRRAAIDDARRHAADAKRRSTENLAKLRSSLEADTVPTLKPEREAAARDEALLLAGDARGDDLIARLTDVAQDGSREALGAILGTSWGRSLLQARGLSRPEQDKALAAIRRTVALGAAEYGATDRERDAGALLNVPDELAAAPTAALSALAETTGTGGFDG